MKILLLLVTVLTFVQFSSCARILFLAPLGSKSHKIFFMSIVEKLADRGHQVTMVSSFEPTKEKKGIREIVVKSYNLDSIVEPAFDDAGAVIRNLILESPYGCASTLAEEAVQNLKKEKFDLVMMSMFFSYCYFSLVDHFKVPFLYVSPAGMMMCNDLMGNIEFPSIVPNVLVGSKSEYTFQERIVSTIINSVLVSAFNVYVLPRTDSVCREMNLCPPSMPSIESYSKNASLAILNEVRAFENPPRPMMPNIIYAGGSHIKEVKPLSKDLEDWVRGSGEAGFIYFSLGSTLKPSLLPENHRQVLIRVFGSLKQRVLWKWDEETMLDLPPNVKLCKWLPQPDILAHPKIRLFITHGGLMSTMESTYHGIPILGLPVFADQFSNMKKIETDGWGRMCYWNQLEESTFRELIMSLINDKSYKEEAKKRSSLMQDAPLPPGEEAVFWIEYVIRHKGAPHIMSPFTNMRWYKIYNMDVWSTLGGVLLLLVYLLWILLKFLFCSGRSIGQSKGKEVGHSKKKREIKKREIKKKI